MSEILALGEPRLHFLLPRRYIGAFTHAKLSPGVTVQDQGRGAVYFYDETAFLLVKRRDVRSRITVTLEALLEIWVQEPGLTVAISGPGHWRGFGPNGWTRTTAGVDGWLSLAGVPDAHLATVHWARVRTSPERTTGAEFRDGNRRWRFRSDGGFESLYRRQPAPAGVVPWQGCVYGSGAHELRGVVQNTSGRARLRWELAAHNPPRVPAFQSWFHMLGWGGGAAGIVDEHGFDTPGEHDRYLWDPLAWRRMRAGDQLEQQLIVR